MEIDVEQIIGEVARKHHFVLDHDDPIIANATVNAAILDQFVRKAGDEISARIATFNGSIDKLERRAGEALGQQTAKLVGELRSQLTEEIRGIQPHRVPDKSSGIPFWVLVCLVSMVSLVLGVCSDRFLR